eukprot:1216471-Rhodomonas_salina.1
MSAYNPQTPRRPAGCLLSQSYFHPSRHVVPACAGTVQTVCCQVALEIRVLGTGESPQSEDVRGLVQTLVACQPPVGLVYEGEVAIDDVRDESIIQVLFQVGRQGSTLCHDANPMRLALEYNLLPLVRLDPF